MKAHAFSCLAVLVFLVSAFSSSMIGQQPPAGRQGGAEAPGGRQGGPPPVQLAEGAGREQVQATCTRCHGVNLIANSWGYTKDGWEDRIATMVKVPAPELEIISSYLAANYPIKDVPGAVLISGPATVTIKEWLAPTLGSRPHDSHAAADGSIWWTGQWATSSDVSIRGRARFANSTCQPRVNRTVWPRIRRGTSGIRPFRRA